MTDLFNQGSGSADDAREQRTAERRRRARKHAQRRRNIISFVVMVVALALLVGGGWVLVRPLLSSDEQPTAEVTDYPGPGSGEVEVVIEEGSSGSDMATALVEADVVATRTAFISAFNANPDAAGIQPGTHVLMQEMSADDAVALMADGTTLADTRLTIPEQWRASQIYERIAQRLEVDVSEVESAADDVAADYLPDVAGDEMEGWLAASTYNVHPDDTATDVLQAMIDRTVEMLDSLEVPPEQREEVLIKASIVEAEVILDDERANVALVIENRLEGCSGDGRLGMDSTVAYGLGITLGEALTQERLREDTAYNTRLNPGLPPGPINSPSQQSIEAVLEPAEGQLCYFVSDLETGESLFAETLEEHNENRAIINERTSGDG
ncbi:endolytic transglycosylase MltG [Ruania suaedae]|uniref:endolytic transglycosylase MltG n=1 Tax=Ruania suaedae TaxID=2897774 RepID=UPI001E55C7BD|nr:endolytic transglycosylase MltG [Ruania suaedae]UFU01555.1 endolytic transglycosylase MltG [Ruania suaedae]